jgi:hypothetical protein
MAWQLLAGALRAALPAAGRTLASPTLKGAAARTVASSALSGNSSEPTRSGNPSLSMSQNKSGNSPIGQLPQG